MLELKISNADLLSRAVRPLIEIDGDGIADYSPDGMSLIAFDPEEIVHVVLSIKPFNFHNDFFRCSHGGIAVVDLDEFQDHLEFEPDEDSITIRAAACEDTFHILFSKVGLIDQFRQLEMELTQVNEDHLDSVRIIQQYEYEAVVGIRSEDFYNIFQQWILSEGPVYVTITHEQVEFSAADESHILPKGLSEQGECIIGGVAEEDQVKLEISLLDIYKFMDACFLSSRVWILHSQDAPTMLNFPVAAIGNIKFYFLQ